MRRGIQQCLRAHQLTRRAKAALGRVVRDERAAFEQAAAREGIAGYAIKEVTAEDRIVPSPAKDEYLPILYSTVGNRRSAISGVDLLSQPSIRERIDSARDTNGLSVVPDFKLHSVAGAVHGFLFSLPVYRTGLYGLFDRPLP